MQKIDLPDNQVGGRVGRKCGRAMPSEHAIVVEIGHVEMTGGVDRDLPGTRYRARSIEVIRIEDQFAEHRACGRTRPRGSNPRHRSGHYNRNCEPNPTYPRSTA